MRSGHATILLRPEHAPCVQPPPPEPPPPAPPGSLRSFRMIRPRVACAAPPAPVAPVAPEPQRVKLEKEETNGDPGPPNGLSSRLRRLLECEPHLGVDTKPPKLEPKRETELEPKFEPTLESKPEPTLEPKPEPRESMSSEEGGGAGALAAAYFARAVLVCRASLYSGLHTIIAPPRAATPPPPVRAECGWCLRRYAARRCLWYGPPRCPPLEARAWRRVRGRRVLCACCTDAAPASAGPAEDGGGWYGKGYRKGRRRRR